MWFVFFLLCFRCALQDLQYLPVVDILNLL